MWGKDWMVGIGRGELLCLMECAYTRGSSLGFVARDGGKKRGQRGQSMTQIHGSDFGCVVGKGKLLRPSSLACGVRESLRKVKRHIKVEMKGVACKWKGVRKGECLHPHGVKGLLIRERKCSAP